MMFIKNTIPSLINQDGKLKESILDGLISLSFKKTESVKITNEDLSELKFVNADFFEVDFSDTNFEKSVFIGCSFNRCDLNNTRFDNAKIINCEFFASAISYSSFKGATVERSNIGTSDLTGSNFKDVILKLSDISGNNLNDTVFRNAKLEDIDFSNSKMNDSCFIDASLSNCCFEEAWLYNSCFGDANISRYTSFSQADTTSVGGFFSIDNIGTFFGKITYCHYNDVVYAGCWSGKLDDFLCQSKHICSLSDSEDFDFDESEMFNDLKMCDDFFKRKRETYNRKGGSKDNG